MRINTICVCGAGTMGSGIAQVAAQSGFKTILYELNAQVLDKARMSIDKSLQVLVEKGKITSDQKDETFAHIIFTSQLLDCKADLIIEAIIENPAIKASLFQQLRDINDEHCIFATNTSSLPVTAIATALDNSPGVIGLHFFNPAPIMKLVEVVTTAFTDPEVVKEIVALAGKMNKVPVVCRDSPGFIVNRVARPFYIESLRLVEEGLTTYEQADKLLEATGFKMGPFKLMDLIGNDVNYAVSCSVYEQLQQPDRLRPSYLQEQKVREGKLGKKSGEGYYPYP